MPIRAIICDFGGVLTTPLLGTFEAFDRDTGITPEHLGTAMGSALERRGEHPLFMLEKGQIAEADFVAELAADLEPLIGRLPDLSDFKERFFSGLAPNEPMIELMAKLANREDLIMSMLTNNVREWRPLWYPMLPVDEIFELVVDSSYVGMRKPDAEIYELTIERINELPTASSNGDGPILPEHCLFIDDMEANIESARALGIASVQVTDTAQAIDEIRRKTGEMT